MHCEWNPEHTVLSLMNNGNCIATGTILISSSEDSEEHPKGEIKANDIIALVAARIYIPREAPHVSWF